jgi:hypothetical protein
MTAPTKKERKMASFPSRFVFSFILFSIGSLLLLRSYWGEKTFATGADAGPMFYPRIILWLWVVLGAAMTIQAVRLPASSGSPWNRRVFYAAAAMILALGFCMEYTGFIAASIAFCWCYPFIQGYRRQKVLILFSLLYTAFVWFLFNNILYIFLPEGIWLAGGADNGFFSGF